MPRVAVVVALLAGCSKPVPTQPAAETAGVYQPEAQVPLDPEVRTGTLDNGLTWFVEPNPWPEDRVELRLVVRAGSVLEDDDQRGAAHFVEHMAFNGTERFPGSELVMFLESTGMRFGPDLNAYTGFDETVYQLQLPTDDPAMLDQGLLVMSEWAHGVTFERGEVEAERGVVLEEWRTGRGASGRLLEATLPYVFHDSRYAERLPIGTAASISALDRDALVRFYEQWYRPDLMAVVVVGDIDPQRAEALIVDHFGELRNPPDERPRPTYEIPIHEETLALVQADPEFPQAGIQLIEKIHWRWGDTWADYRETRVEDLYLDMMNERLGEIALRRDAPFLAAGIGRDMRTPDVSFQSLSVTPHEGQEAEALEAAMAEVVRAREHGFTEAELERAKARQRRAMETWFQERQRTPSSVAAEEIVRHYLYNEPMPGTPWEYEAFEEILPTVTLADVNRQADAFLDDGGRVVLAAVPANRPAPTEEALLESIDQAEETDLGPWVEREVPSTLVATPPEPGRIVKREKIPEIGVTVWTLSNGARVLLKPTDFKSDEIRIGAWSWGGTSTVSDADYPSAELATSIAQRSGLGDLELPDLVRALAGKEAAVQPYTTELTEGVLGGAAPEDLDTALQLVWLTFTEPRFDLDAYEVEIRNQRELLRNRTANPMAVFEDELDRVLYNGHPRRRAWTVEDIEKVDLRTAEDFYEQRFGDADGFTFVFVGNFEPAEIEDPVRTWLGSLPTRPGEDTWRDVGARPAEGPIHRVVRAGIEDKAFVRVQMNGEAPFDREQAHRLSLVGEALETRLREQLREELGGTYGVGVQTAMFRYPFAGYRVVIQFETDPTRVDEMRAVVYDSMEELRTQRIGEPYIQTWAAQERRALETDAKDNGAWLGWLMEYEQAGWPLEDILELEPLLADDTPASVQAAAQRYLHPDRAVEVDLMPREDRTETGALTSPPR